MHALTTHIREPIQLLCGLPSIFITNETFTMNLRKRVFDNVYKSIFVRCYLAWLNYEMYTSIPCVHCTRLTYTFDNKIRLCNVLCAV